MTAATIDALAVRVSGGRATTAERLSGGRAVSAMTMGVQPEVVRGRVMAAGVTGIPAARVRVVAS